MLNAYGENGFTYLFFQQLHATERLVDPFLWNLKQFSTGSTFQDLHEDACREAENGALPEVWLFPNFGKSSGFGEPDAIILHHGHSFWIEVETEFDLIRNRSVAEKALLQLFRFHYFSQVLKGGSSTPEGQSHLAYMGPTIRNNGQAKLGVLRVAGHRVLQRISKQLAESVRNEKDHYVLLSIQQMNGIDKKDEVGATKLCSLFEDCAHKVHPKVAELSLRDNPPSQPSIKRFWYEYLNGDLSRFADLSLADGFVGYVPRKKS